MTHEEYAAVQLRNVIRLCRQVVRGTIPAVYGCLELASYGPQAIEVEYDPDIEFLVQLATEFDLFPSGSTWKLLSPELLAKRVEEKRAAEGFYAEDIKAACERILQRYELPPETENES